MADALPPDLLAALLPWLAHWYLLPVGLVISALYSSTGISGANFWALVFIIGLRLEPRTGFWLSLIAMLFGSAGGLLAHHRRSTLRPELSAGYLLSALPAAVAGTVVASRLPPKVLMALFGVFLLLYAGTLFFRSGPKPGHRRPRHRVSGSGGFLTGLLSVGVGEVLLPEALDREEIDSSAVAAGTTLLVVCLTSLTAAAVRLEPGFAQHLWSQRGPLATILLWVVPGVLLGSQLGPVIAARFDRRAMTRYVALVLVVVGLLMLGRGVGG